MINQKKQCYIKYKSDFSRGIERRRTPQNASYVLVQQQIISLIIFHQHEVFSGLFVYGYARGRAWRRPNMYSVCLSTKRVFWLLLSVRSPPAKSCWTTFFDTVPENDGPSSTTIVGLGVDCMRS